MDYFERESSKLYFELTRFGFHQGHLSWAHYLDRLLALRDMCEHDDPIKKLANRTLLVEEWSSDDEWNRESEEKDKAKQEGSNETTRTGLTIDKEGYLQFLSRKKGLNDWVFHQYDVDFHPSIPHGHFKGNKQPKLDCYLGWIYKGSKQTGRLSRNLIIELWNDDEFRVFAYTSIEWYMLEFPKYNWRVDNPLRLPRRR